MPPPPPPPPPSPPSNIPPSFPPDLADELTSLNSIYGDNTLLPSSPPSPSQDLTLILALPSTPTSLLLSFPPSYPSSPPTLLRISHVDASLPKGFGAHILSLAREILTQISESRDGAGEVLLYDLIEGVEARLASPLSPSTSTSPSPAEPSPSPPRTHEDASTSDLAVVESRQNGHHHHQPSPAGGLDPPKWFSSHPITSHKSTFTAHATAITSPLAAHEALIHLLATDKKVAKATHNMWAYRVKSPPSDSSDREVVYTDCSDDGESGAGAKLAGLLQAMGAWGVLVVVSRWYGGVKLGAERWRIIGSVAREAVVKGAGKEEDGGWEVERGGR